MAPIPEMKSLSRIDPEKIFVYGLMAIALFIMVAKLNHVIEYGFVGLLVLWIALKVQQRNFHFVRTPLDIPIFFFVAWIFISIPFAIDPSYSFAEWRKTLLQVLMFYFVVNVVRHETQVKKILLALVVGLVVSSLLGIVEQFMESDNIFDRDIRAQSLTQSGQWLASFLVMGGPFVWLFYQEHEGRVKLLIGSLLVITLTALVLSHTRGAWLAFLAQLATFLVIRLKMNWVKWSLLLLLLLCGVIFMGSQVLEENSSGMIEGNSFSNFESMDIRLDTWQIAFEQIKENPILGYGYGNHTFQKTNEQIQVGGSGIPSIGMHLHNVFVSMAYEVGLVGLVLFSLIFFLIIKAAIQGDQEYKGTFVGNVGVSVLLLAIGVITRNMFDNMFVGTLAYLFWMLTGLYFALLWLQKQSVEVELR